MAIVYFCLGGFFGILYVVLAIAFEGNRLPSILLWIIGLLLVAIIDKTIKGK